MATYKIIYLVLSMQTVKNGMRLLKAKANFIFSDRRRGTFNILLAKNLAYFWWSYYQNWLLITNLYVPKLPHLLLYLIQQQRENPSMYRFSTNLAMIKDKSKGRCLYSLKLGSFKNDTMSIIKICFTKPIYNDLKLTCETKVVRKFWPCSLFNLAETFSRND